MSKQDISEALGMIRQDYITDAAFYAAAQKTHSSVEMHKEKAPHKRWTMLVSAAACLLLIATAGLLFLPSGSSSPEHGRFVTPEELCRPYIKTPTLAAETYQVLPWQYKTAVEKYTTLLYEGREYHTCAEKIGTELLGTSLGTCEVSGYDCYEERSHTIACDIREVAGILPEFLVAVKLDESYYVFLKDDDTPPETLGELIDRYDLTNTLHFSLFHDSDDHADISYYAIAEDEAIRQILLSCRDAQVAHLDFDFWAENKAGALDFSVTSEALGVRNLYLAVAPGGYLRTNIFNYAYDYDIGKTAAEAILAYAKQNGEKTELPVHTYQVSGTIVEIGEGHLVIDDAILCEDSADGMRFTVPTDAFAVDRLVKLLKLQVGDLILARFTGNIDTEKNNTLSGVESIYRAILVDGEILIPE